MRILVFGADGFIGRNVCKELSDGHEIYKASLKNFDNNSHRVKVDLLNKSSIAEALHTTKPDFIINCAGVVDATMDTGLNVEFTENILSQVAKTDGVKRVIICGSAGEYGQVNYDDIPVNERAPLNADGGYGLSKKLEEQKALEYSEKYDIDIVVLRIFNPIGIGMANKFLLTRLLEQVEEYRQGKRSAIEISRLDSKRDYIAVGDVAKAIRVIIEGSPRENIYNVGSGISTSNGDLLQLIIKNSKLESMPEIVETSDQVEPLVATQADITRISNEFNWRPLYKIDDVVRNIVYDKN